MHYLTLLRGTVSNNSKLLNGLLFSVQTLKFSPFTNSLLQTYISSATWKIWHPRTALQEYHAPTFGIIILVPRKLSKMENTRYTDTSDLMLQHFTSVWFCSCCVFCISCVFLSPPLQGRHRNPDQEWSGWHMNLSIHMHKNILAPQISSRTGFSLCTFYEKS